MLDGRYPSQEFGELRARIVWDRVAGTIRARKGSRQLVVTNAGTIPDRGLFSVTLPDGRRVGELDEEMVYEARPGQTFLLGASTWRIEEIGRDRVIVTPAPGAPGAVPFWRGDGVGRPKELGKAIGAFSRWAVDQDAETLEADYDLDAFAARNLLAYLREQQDATRVLPSDRTIVVERFRDEIGDWRLCVLSPYGGRVHAAWGLALSRRIRETYGLESDAIWSDDGIIVHLPDADEPPGAELVMVEPDEVEDAVVAELSSSALFGARFRENAGRALLIPRAYPGKRTPLWQQRLKSQSLLEVAKRYPDFPIILETYRECLRDVLDVPGLVELLRGLHARELSLVEVETPTASPFASSLLFDYVATYMYEGDSPNAERRAAALSLDRDLLRELLGQEELRELIDAGALDQVEADLQHRSDRTRAETRDALADVLRRVGDLTLEEVRDRVLPGIDAAKMLDTLAAERRAIRLRIGGEQRWVAADDAGLYRDALGTAPPGGLPDAFTADVPDALRTLVARYARTHGPFTTGRAARALPRRCDRGARGASSATARSCAASCVPVAVRASRSGVTPTSCDGCAARRWRRCARRSSPPTSARWRRFCRRGRASTAIRRPAPGSTACARCSSRCRASRCPPRCGSATCCRAARAPTRRRGWTQLCASGELVWVGAGSLGRSTGRVALYFRDDAEAIGRVAPPRTASPPAEREHELLRERLAASPCFFTDLLAEVALSPEEVQEALWDLVWAGEVTNDAFAPLRAPRLTLARAQRAPRHGARAFRLAAQRDAADRPGPLGADRHDLPPRTGARTTPPHAGRAAARALRHRHARAGARRGRARRLLDPLRRAVAARDARDLPPRLLRRGSRRRAVRASGRGRAAARAAPARRGPAARARRDRSRPALRRGPAVAAPRATTAAVPRAFVARTSCSPAPSRCCTSRRAGAASSRSSSRAIAGSTRRSKRSPRSSWAVAGASSRSSASTASRSSDRASSRCSSSSASAPGRASSRSARRRAGRARGPATTRRRRTPLRQPIPHRKDRN